MGGSNFALAQSGSGNSANRTDFKPQKAKTIEIGSKWQVFDNRLQLNATLFRTDIENEVQANDDGTYSQYGTKRVEGYELTAMGNITPDWQVIGGYTLQHASVREGSNVAQDGSSDLPYTPDTPLPCGLNIRPPRRFRLAAARAMSAVCIAGPTAR